MRFRVLLLLLILLLMAPALAWAQGEVVIETLQAEFWPEYDRPEMLVIYRIQLNAETPLPAALRIPMPAAVGAPSAVAILNASGQLVNAPYELEQVGTVLYVLLESPSRLAQVEYYDPALTRVGTTRSYIDRIQFGVPIRNLVLRVQQPLGASGLTVQPGEVSQAVEADGLTYASASLGSLAADEALEVSIGYEKTGDGLSVAGLAPVAAVPGVTSGNNLQVLAWALGVAGLGLLGFAAWRYVNESKTARPSRARRRVRRVSGSGSTADATGFCHKCGAAAQAGDVFCRACGTRLRR